MSVRTPVGGWLLAGLLAAAVPAAALTEEPGAGTPTSPGRLVDVVVQSTVDAERAAHAVRVAGGTVTRWLPIVDGVGAVVPAAGVAALGRATGVLAVTLNTPVSAAAVVQQESAPTETVKQAFLTSTGALKLHARGITGAATPGTRTRVALIDTGVDTEAASSGDLAGRVVPVKDPSASSLDAAQDVACVNFSGEAGCDDTYGHGTFMAGLIAGDGRASDGDFSGAAPGAELISIKIAGATGAADVTKVLAAVQWVVSFADRYDIGVLNLSLGSNSRTDPRVDPLNRAVQRAWDAGIVVVAAAGNNGRADRGEPWTITKPADDPLVVTVGATDDRETPATSDDRVPRFSSRGGPGLAKPDLASPGAHLVSLRAVGSTVDRVGRPLDATYRRGSGTSMAAAVVSGAVSLVRQARPDWTPDEVKQALRTTARKVAVADPLAIGSGLPDAFAAVSAPVDGYVQPRPSSGPLGQLDPSRADLVVTGPACGLAALLALPRPSSGELEGQCTAQGRPFDAGAYTEAWTEQAWYAGQFAGNDWTGNDWTGNDWTGNDWTGNDWTGADWGTGSDDTERYGDDASLLRGSLLYGSAR